MMFVATLLLVGFTAMICAKRLYGSVINPVSFYVVPWVLCSLLACSGMYGIYPPSSLGLSLILFGIASFFVGCVVTREYARAGKTRVNMVSMPVGHVMHELSCYKGGGSRRIFILLNVIAIAVSAVYTARTIPLLLSGYSMSYIKFQYSNTPGATLFTTRELLFYQWVILPISTASMAVSASALARDEPDGLAFLFSAAEAALHVVISGGRNSGFQLVVFVVIGFLIAEQKGDILLRLRNVPRYIRLGIIFIVVAIALITNVRRMRSDSSITENMFFYSAGAITFFDTLVNNPVSFGLEDAPLLGRATLGFVLNPFHIVLSLLLRFDYVGSDSIITSATSGFLNLSDSILGNAMFTCLYPFMRDFGYIGVILGPCVFGSIVSYAWERAHRNDTATEVWLLICIFLLYCVVFSTWRYMLLFPSSGITLFLIVIMSKDAKAHSAAKIPNTTRVL